MAISNFTGTTQLADSVAAEQIGRFVETAYAKALALNFLTAFGGADTVTGTKTKSYPRLGSLSAGALTEGTDATATALSDTEVSITVVEIGVGVLRGDVLDVAESPGGWERLASLMGKAYADYVDTRILALNPSFTDQVGPDNTPITEDIFLQAIHELEENQGDGPFFSILYTQHIHDLRVLIGGASANTGPVFMRPDIVSGLGPATSTGFALTLYGVDVFKSTNCPTDGSGADRIGCMLPAHADQYPIRRLVGVPGQGPYSGQPWDGRVEYERDASGRLTEVWMTGLEDEEIVAVDWGVGVNARDT